MRRVNCVRSDGIVWTVLATAMTGSTVTMSPTFGSGAVGGRGGGGGGASPFNSPAFRSRSATAGEITTASVIVFSAIAILLSCESNFTKPHIGPRAIQAIRHFDEPRTTGIRRRRGSQRVVQSGAAADDELGINPDQTRCSQVEHRSAGLALRVQSRTQKLHRNRLVLLSCWPIV